MFGQPNASGLLSNPAMMITPSGKVSIGITGTPAEKFEINGGADYVKTVIRTTNPGAHSAVLRLQNSAGAYNDVMEIGHGAGETTFKNGAGTNIMKLNATNGNVGIGIAGTPTERLEVAGNVKATNVQATGNVDIGGSLTTTSGFGLMKIYSTTSDNWASELTITIPANAAPNGMLITAHAYITNQVGQWEDENIYQEVYIDTHMLGHLNQTIFAGATGPDTVVKMEGDYSRPFYLASSNYASTLVHTIKMPALKSSKNISLDLPSSIYGSQRRTLVVIIY